MGRYHRPASGSRASVERIVGSGSEPMYLPLTNTSCDGLVLCVLGAANALEAVAMAMVIASAVLVNMVMSPVVCSITPHRVYGHLEPAGQCRESPGGPAIGRRSCGVKRPSRSKTACKQRISGLQTRC